jgi:hypothetical protein
MHEVTRYKISEVQTCDVTLPSLSWREILKQLKQGIFLDILNNTTSRKGNTKNNCQTFGRLTRAGCQPIMRQARIDKPRPSSAPRCWVNLHLNRPGRDRCYKSSLTRFWAEFSETPGAAARLAETAAIDTKSPRGGEPDQVAPRRRISIQG